MSAQRFWLLIFVVVVVVAIPVFTESLSWLGHHGHVGDLFKLLQNELDVTWITEYRFETQCYFWKTLFNNISHAESLLKDMRELKPAFKQLLYVQLHLAEEATANPYTFNTIFNVSYIIACMGKVLVNTDVGYSLNMDSMILSELPKCILQQYAHAYVWVYLSSGKYFWNCYFDQIFDRWQVWPKPDSVGDR